PASAPFSFKMPGPTSSEVRGTSTSNLPLENVPFTSPSRHLPVIFSPSCWKVGSMIRSPSSVCSTKCHFPDTFAAPCAVSTTVVKASSQRRLFIGGNDPRFLVFWFSTLRFGGKDSRGGRRPDSFSG